LLTTVQGYTNCLI